MFSMTITVGRGNPEFDFEDWFFSPTYLSYLIRNNFMANKIHFFLTRSIQTILVKVSLFYAVTSYTPLKVKYAQLDAGFILRH
jgi:hypothetical protein